jgi:hypothetical protein
MTGDIDSEIVIAIIDPMSEANLPWTPGDVLIFRCRAGAVAPAFAGRLAIDGDAVDLQFSLEMVEDVNATGRADVVYTVNGCGAHTCWGRLYIVEWDGVGFVNRIPEMKDSASPTFTVQDRRVVVDIGGIGSAGAGHQRSQQEIWEWDGRQFSLSEQITGPPTAVVHYLHDADEALARGDYGEAIGYYEQVQEETRLPAGLFLETEEQSLVVMRAYARFKLIVAYAVSGDLWRAQKQYDALLAEHPGGTPGSPYVILGEVFWSEFLTDEAPAAACAAAVVIGESNPTLAEQLYAGYANPEYEAADLCKIGR